MNYGRLIRESWSTTWHHRFLWVLGLFTGAAVGTCSGVSNQSPLQYQAQSSDLSRVLPEVETAAANVEQWVSSHTPLVGLAIVLLVALGLAFLIVSFIAQGGMTEATIDLARNQATSLGQAWRTGRHVFWRFVGLAVVPMVVAMGLAAAIGAALVVAIAISAALSGAVKLGVILLGVVIGAVALVLLIAFAIIFSIVLAYAQRAVVAENVGPVSAIRSGWQVFRRHVGDSLLVWLIGLGLGIAANFAVAAAVVLVGILLFGVGVVLWSAIGFTTVTGVYLGLGIAAAIAVAWLLEAIVNTFLWDFWTLAYLQLTGATRGEV